MCGIFGISYGPGGPSDEDWSPSELMALMFPAIVHRGPHAYGWMYYDGETVWYQKYVGRADTPEAMNNFWIDPEHEDKVQWLVGHVRYATHGSPEDLRNNHPLSHGSIIGVHNGVLRNHNQILAETGREDPLTEVDSEAIFAAVNKWGHREGLRKIVGDMVTVYCNLEKPATLHLARSHGRPLMIARTPAESTIFASETGVINATGIETTPASPLSTYRLIRMRGGRITERINYLPNGGTVTPRPTSGGSVLTPRRPTGSWFHDNYAADRATRRGQMLFDRLNTNPDVRDANLTAAMQDRRERARRLQKAAQDPRAKKLKNHEQFDGFYYLDGVLMDEDQYLQMIAEREEFANILDEEDAQPTTTTTTEEA